MIFKGSVNDKPVIHLYLADNHYTIITSVAAFFGKAYFCDGCDKVSKKRGA